MQDRHHRQEGHHLLQAPLGPVRHREVFQHGPGAQDRGGSGHRGRGVLEFVGEEVDKVELVYSRFVSLILAEPSIQTILPLSKEGEICDVNGKCVDANQDVVFTLTSEDGKFAVKSEKVETEVAGFEGVMQFEQDPNQILDALLPLHELADSPRAPGVPRLRARRAHERDVQRHRQREGALQVPFLEYNRKRQAKITSEIIELVAGASAM